jgi:alpha-beta hydrolase superfamily lysophospholipase
MLDTSSILYIHGSDSDSTSGKARQFREWLPGMVTPDFKGSFDERMSQLYSITSNKTEWTLIGSSYGGLMATVFALDHESQLRKLILLAPALMLEPLTSRSTPTPVSVPTTLIHGTLDTVVLFEPVREIAQKLFTNLTVHLVEDDHRLHKTANELDWKSILD